MCIKIEEMEKLVQMTSPTGRKITHTERHLRWIVFFRKRRFYERMRRNPPKDASEADLLVSAAKRGLLLELREFRNDRSLKGLDERLIKKIVENTFKN